LWQEQASIEVNFTQKNVYNVFNENSRNYYVANPVSDTEAMDNKKFFTWTASGNYEQFNSCQSKKFKITIKGPSNVHVTNAKFFVVKCVRGHEENDRICTQCDQKPCAIIQTQQNVWIADIEFNFPRLFCFKADIIRQISPYFLNIVKNVSGLLTTGRYTDLVVFAKDQKFKCHKAMLMEKSPVFEAMVRNTLLDFVF
jgi:hypothetical protein